MQKTQKKTPDGMLRRMIAMTGCATVAVLLAGCSLLDGPTPERPTRPAVVVPEEEAHFSPEGSAADNQPIFLQTLQHAASQEGQIASQTLAQQFVAVGFDPALMQVSQDRTRTDLEPESMFISALFGGDCIVGQIVTADRSFDAQVVPAVGPDNNLCLIGLTIPIE